MIRRVPESTKTLNGKAYTPRLVGMGPYHHFHPRLYKMEGVKLAAAKSGLRRFNIPDMDSFLRQLRPFMPRIRACYDGVFLLPHELELAVAIDGLFFLSLLCDEMLLRRVGEPAAEPEKLTVARKLMSAVEDFWKLLRRVSHRPGTTDSDDDRRRPAGGYSQLDVLISAVVNDAVLMENQVPISILAEAVAPFRPDVGQLVAGHLHDLCTFLSPVRLIGATRNSSVPATHYLLEYLYLRITAGDCNGDSPGTVHRGDLVVNMNRSSVNVVAVDGGAAAYEALRKFGPLVPPLAVLAQHKLARILLMLGRLTSFGLLDYFIPGTPRNEDRTSPTATQLGRIGLRFEPKRTPGLAIDLDEEAHTVFVPVFRWHPHSDVVTLNLVAYEAAAAAAATNGGSDVFTHYVHFLHMVARTRQDVELLIKTGVVVVTSNNNNNNAVDATAAVRFFLSMPPPPRDNVAVAVKRYYNSRPRVVVRGWFARIGCVLALFLLWAAEAIAVYVIFCGILMKVTGCSFGGGDGSCTVNVVTPTLMSVVDVHGNIPAAYTSEKYDQKKI